MSRVFVIIEMCALMLAVCEPHRAGIAIRTCSTEGILAEIMSDAHRDCTTAPFHGSRFQPYGSVRPPGCPMLLLHPRRMLRHMYCHST